MTEKRVFNFSAGPSMLPVPVLEKADKQNKTKQNKITTTKNVEMLFQAAL